MSTSTVFKTWYRSVDKDGKLWAESSNFDEILESLKDIPGGSMHKLEQVLVTGNWEQMSKKDVRHAKYKVPDRSDLDMDNPSHAAIFRNRVRRANGLIVTDGFKWHELTDKEIRKRLEELDRAN
jgi:hypothetical protein